jgi:hypothetical protein
MLGASMSVAFAAPTEPELDFHSKLARPRLDCNKTQNAF